MQRDEESPLAFWAHGIVHIIAFPPTVDAQAEIRRLSAQALQTK